MLALKVLGFCSSKMIEKNMKKQMLVSARKKIKWAEEKANKLKAKF
jgi:hypothetical protein